LDEENEVKRMRAESKVDIQQLLVVFERLAKAEWRKQPAVGLKNSEVRTLLCIKSLSQEEQTAVTVSEISKKMFVTSPTVTQIMKSLDTNGYVERRVDAHDKRVVAIMLTEKGKNTVQQVDEYMNTLFAGLVDELGEEQSETLLLLLNQVCNYLENVDLER